jgi:hypothetical protein
MKYAGEIGTGVMIYILRFINIGSTIQKLMREGDTQTHSQYDDCISLLLFFKIREVD